jgi:SAM-dependent methyltransferase
MKKILSVFVFMLFILFVFVQVGCVQLQRQNENKPELPFNASVAQSASGEWHWENFTEEEIDGWSQMFYPSFFTILYRWNEAGVKTILDVGAGQGAHSVIFAKKGFNVSSVDINKFAMGRLAKIATEQNLPIKTKVGDARALPYPDKSFDAVFANQIVNLNGCAAMPEIIAELFRVAKDGGQIFFTTNIWMDESNSLFKKGLVGADSDCVQGEHSNEVICSSDNKYKTVYCGVSQTMLEEMLKPYEVGYVYLTVFFNKKDLFNPILGIYYNIMIRK